MDLKTIENVTKKSPLFGVSHSYGKEFDDINSCAEKGFSFPNKIVLRKGAILDQISFNYEGLLTSHGGTGGRKCEFVLEKNEYIIKVEGNSAEFGGRWIIENLAFHTNKGRVFSLNTPNKSKKYFSYAVQNNYAICCLYGRVDRFVGCIGFYERKIEMDLKGMISGIKLPGF